MANMTILRRAARKLRQKLGLPSKPEAFHTSHQYWLDRYSLGGNSGPGSYGRLAEFKAATLNRFVAEKGLKSVVELGCGDGAQLQLSRYPAYTGLDISPHAIELCRKKFSRDRSKRFLLTSDPASLSVTADIALSLDVLYHLIEDEVYDEYMRRLATAASQYICVYSGNIDSPSPDPHVRHRCFTDWFPANAPQWALIGTVENPYPDDPADPDNTTWANFFFFEKRASTDPRPVNEGA